MSASFSPAFLACCAVLLKYEGGYVNNPADPGGETKFGISKRVYPSLDIATLTVADAQAIYHTDYWLRICGDDMPVVLAMVTLDAAVNNGVSEASRWLQAEVGAEQDGDIGQMTVDALMSVLPHKPASKIAAGCLAARIMHMAALPEWHDFAGGWSTRLATLPFDAMALQQQLSNGPAT